MPSKLWFGQQLTNPNIQAQGANRCSRPIRHSCVFTGLDHQQEACINRNHTGLMFVISAFTAGSRCSPAAWCSHTATSGQETPQGRVDAYSGKKLGKQRGIFPVVHRSALQIAHQHRRGLLKAKASPRVCRLYITFPNYAMESITVRIRTNTAPERLHAAVLVQPQHQHAFFPAFCQRVIVNTSQLYHQEQIPPPEIKVPRSGQCSCC